MIFLGESENEKSSAHFLLAVENEYYDGDMIAEAVKHVFGSELLMLCDWSKGETNRINVFITEILREPLRRPKNIVLARARKLANVIAEIARREAVRISNELDNQAEEETRCDF